LALRMRGPTTIFDASTKKELRSRLVCKECDIGFEGDTAIAATPRGARGAAEVFFWRIRFLVVTFSTGTGTARVGTEWWDAVKGVGGRIGAGLVNSLRAIDGGAMIVEFAF
jgi:hypothetical protein